jgi:endonuclease/exonuclease/phosphatase (EEP) superfamily protein YafD
MPTKTPMLRLVQARLHSGQTLVIGSIRLPPTPFRQDLWSRSCWQVYAADRRMRREALQLVEHHLRGLPKELPIILGGDFNAPAGDAIFRLLQPHFLDAYAEAGWGWGGTLHNDFPVLRIDQIWLTRQFRVASLVTRKTQYSDHRMVICDVILSNSPSLSQ